MDRTTAVYQGLRDYLARHPGRPLPTRKALVARFGGISLEAMGQIVVLLERENRIRRVSQRKFMIVDPAAPETLAPKPGERNVGLVGFDGHLYGEFAQRLFPRLYDRRLLPCVMPVIHASALESMRVAAHFFNLEFEAVLVRPLSGIGPELLGYCRARQIIELFEPYLPAEKNSNKVFFYMDFFAFDALRNLYRAGYREVDMLFPFPRFDADGRANDYLKGIDRGRKAHPDMVVHHRGDLSRIDAVDDALLEWVKGLSPGTRAIVCGRDFEVIKIRQAMGMLGIDHRRYQFIGCGNTDWSNHGVDLFPSYDFRLNELVNLTLDYLDTPPAAPAIKKIKPRLVNADRLRPCLPR